MFNPYIITSNVRFRAAKGLDSVRNDCTYIFSGAKIRAIEDHLIERCKLVAELAKHWTIIQH